MLSLETSFINSLKEKLVDLKKFESNQCNSDEFDSMFDKKKFTVNEYTVKTEDGYLNKLFRVGLTQSEKDKLTDAQKQNINKPILLQHGLLDSADGWFVAAEKSVGFHLVNNGYDVWVGNNRGNKYSLSHTDPNISKYDFWDFCWDEMGIYDLPAFYQFIMDTTGKDKITYFGHSEGTSQMFVGGVDDHSKDFLTKHTEKFIALAPVIFLRHVESPLLQFLASVNKILIPLWNKSQMYNFAPSLCHEPVLLADFAQFFCSSPFGFICKHIVPGLDITDQDSLLDNIHIALQHYTSGTGWLNIVKYGQAIAYKDEEVLYRLDRGPEANMKKYGQTNPPALDVKKFDIPTALIGGTNDELGDVKDVTELAAILDTSKTSLHFMNFFDHLAFIFPRYPTELLSVIDKELAMISNN